MSCCSADVPITYDIKILPRESCLVDSHPHIRSWRPAVRSEVVPRADPLSSTNLADYASANSASDRSKWFSMSCASKRYSAERRERGLGSGRNPSRAKFHDFPNIELVHSVLRRHQPYDNCLSDACSSRFMPPRTSLLTTASSRRKGNGGCTAEMSSLHKQDKRPGR